MESEEIPNSALKSSSVYNQYSGPERSRLNKKQEGSYYGGWASKHADVGQWLQIDLGKITKVTRIATQGRYDANWWVTKYSLTYSDGGQFKSYKNGEVCITTDDLHFHLQCPRLKRCLMLLYMFFLLQRKLQVIWTEIQQRVAS